MKEKHTDSVQNRFTAYLMAAVVNKRISYMEQRNRRKEREYIQMDLLEKNHVDFDAQYHTYLTEQSLFAYFGYGENQECMPELDSIQLAKCINRLKDRERRILFARVFGELNFYGAWGEVRYGDKAGGNGLLLYHPQATQRNGG